MTRWYMVYPAPRPGAIRLQRRLTLGGRFRPACFRNFLPGIPTSLGYAPVLYGRFAEGCVLVEEAVREHVSTGALKNCS
jgi:hypothetical protein